MRAVRLVLRLAAASSAVACGSAPATPDARAVDGVPVDDATQADATQVDARTAEPPARRSVAFRTSLGLHVFAPRGETFAEVFADYDGAHFAVAACGDLDGDGIDEIAASWMTLDTSDFHTRLYRYDAGFGFSQTFPGVASKLMWFDANGDSLDDLWIASSSDTLLVSDGTMLARMWWATGPTGYSLAAGDFDGDGDLDVAKTTGSVAILFRNDGDGEFSIAWQTVLDDSQSIESVSTITVGGVTTLVVHWWRLGEGLAGWWELAWDGTTFVQTNESPPGLFATRTRWSDFDGDGDEDPLVWTREGMVLHRRDGDEFVPLWTLDDVANAQWGDFDGDHDPDLAFTALNADDGRDLVILQNERTVFTEVFRTAAGDGSIAWCRCASILEECYPGA